MVRRSKWGHYLKRAAEGAALVGVQFVPGLDVAADAALAGEAATTAAAAAEGAEAVEGAATLAEGAEATESTSLLSKGQKLYDKANDYYDKYQEYQGYYNQITGSNGQQKPKITYRGQHPMPVAAAYREPPHHYLGPMQKKILIFGLIFAVVMIIIAIIARHYIRSYHGCSKSI